MSINANPLIVNPSLIGAGVGSLGGYLLSKIDNDEFEKLKYEDPEKYKKLKRKRALKYALAGGGIGLGAGLGGSIGLHAYRRKKPVRGLATTEDEYVTSFFIPRKKGSFYTNKFEGDKNIELDSQTGSDVISKSKGMIGAMGIQNDSKNAKKLINNKPVIVNKFNKINLSIPLKEKRNGRSMLMWVTFDGVPNPDQAMQRIKKMCSNSGVTIDKSNMELIRNYFAKRYSFI